MLPSDEISLPIVIDPLAPEEVDIVRIVAYVESSTGNENYVFHCFTNGQCEMLKDMGYKAELLHLNWSIESRMELFINFRRSLNEADGCLAELSGPSPGRRTWVNIANVARGVSFDSAHLLLAKGFEQILRHSRKFLFLAITADNYKIAVELLKRLSPKSIVVNCTSSMVALRQSKKEKKSRALYVRALQTCMITLFNKLTKRKFALVFGKRGRSCQIEDVPQIESPPYRMLQQIFSSKLGGRFEILTWKKLPVSDNLPRFARVAVEVYEEVLKSKLVAQMPLFYGGIRALDLLHPSYILTPQTNNFEGEVFRSWRASNPDRKLILYQHGLNADLQGWYPRKIEADMFFAWLSVHGGGVSLGLNEDVEVVHVGHNNGAKISASWVSSRGGEVNRAEELKVLYAPTSRGGLYLDVEEIIYRRLVEFVAPHVSSICVRLHPKSFLKSQMKRWVLGLDASHVSFDEATDNIEWCQYDVLVTTYSTLALDAIKNNVPVVEYDWCGGYYPLKELIQTILRAKTETEVLSNLMNLRSERARAEQVYRQVIHYNNFWA